MSKKQSSHSSNPRNAMIIATTILSALLIFGLVFLCYVLPRDMRFSSGTKYIASVSDLPTTDTALVSLPDGGTCTINQDRFAKIHRKHFSIDDLVVVHSFDNGKTCRPEGQIMPGADLTFGILLLLLPAFAVFKYAKHFYKQSKKK